MRNRSGTAGLTPAPARRAVRACAAGTMSPSVRGARGSSFSGDSSFIPALAVAALITTLFAACSSQGIRERSDHAPPGKINISSIPNAVPRHEPRSRYGNPVSYVVNGHRYYTRTSSKGYVQRGIASWYGTKFNGQRTSSGDIYDLYKMTAAHKTLPLPTYARVTNLQSGRSVIVKINDRGPFHPNRIIDLSYAAAAKLGILAHGTGLVEVRAIDPSARPKPAQISHKRAVRHAPSLFLQVGAFRNRNNAARLSRKLKESRIDKVRIVKGSNSGGPLYRVRVGPLRSVDEADRISSNLVSLGFSDPRVVVN